MKNYQKGFSSLLLIIILILVITSGWYILSQNKDRSNTQVQNSATTTSRIMMTRDTMVGAWQSGGSDSGGVTLELEPTGNFLLKEVYLHVEAPEGSNFPDPDEYKASGVWSVETNSDQSYLSLKFDTDFYPPSTPEMIEQYRGWGQEFFGKNEVRVKLEYYQDDPELMFRYDGYLMEKIK